MYKIKKTGLPKSINMRHDKHFVELIASRSRGPITRMIPIVKIYPNPYQARSELGNINELMLSIKSKGILEPILVRPKDNKYEIIAGERRYIAAKRIGLTEIPCIEMDVEDNEAMELALIENLQRKDLDAFEEANGLKSLIDIYGYTHSQISEKIGKARSTITEIINIAKIPNEIRELCNNKNIKNRSTLIEISKLKSKEDMKKLLNEIIERGLRRTDTRELSKKIKGEIKRIKHFVYNYAPNDHSYRLRIEFKKQNIDKTDIIRILKEILRKLSYNK
ncbi:MAG: ParB/RepB/Spo0J family partition protein [Candidatus Aminicenantaceae bacterium]